MSCRRIARLWPLLAVVAPAACALWAFAPFDDTIVVPPQLPESHAQPANEPRPLELAGFSAPLWIAPPAPPPPPPPEPTPRKEPPPPPLKLQLLAIVREPEALKAILYDPDTDRLLTVVSGEHLDGRTIERVLASAVEIRDKSGLRTLTLAEGGRAP